MKRVKTIIILGLGLLSLFTQAQKLPPTPYKVGIVPYTSIFNKLTPEEVYLDTSLYNSHKLIMDALLDGTGLVKGVSEKEKQLSIEQEKNDMMRYRDNRSRIYLRSFRNNVKVQEGMLPTMCDCSLIGNTIKIRMGLIFGDIIDIDLYKETFKSNYSEGLGNEQMLYKTSITDTAFHQSIKVRNIKEILILKARPTFRIGDKIEGFLEFKSKDFYKLEGWEIGLQEPRLNKLFSQGGMNFKCDLKKNLLDRLN